MIFNPNICGCRAVYTKPPCPSSNSSNCLRLCDFISGSDESVWPCNEQGAVLFQDKLDIPDACTPEFSIVEHTDNLRDVTIDATGVAFTSNWSEGLSYLVAEITYKVCCGALSDIAKVTIFFRKGEKLECEKCFTYNPCNGECEEDVPNVGVSVDAGSDAINITIEAN